MTPVFRAPAGLALPGRYSSPNRRRTPAMTITIRPPRPDDRAAWGRLYAGYADFYRVTQT